MKGRIASAAFLLATLATGITWLTVQPVLLRLLGALERSGLVPSVELAARTRGLLPFYLGLDFLLAFVVAFTVLHLFFERPFARAERALDSMSRMSPVELPSAFGTMGGNLETRLDRALNRLGQALRAEQEVTARQLKELGEKNEALARTQTELVAAERLASVGRLAAGVAHEVGNPLSGILGYLSLVRARVGQDSEASELLDRIDGEVVRIEHIVRGLLDLGRPVRGRSGPVELARVIDSCVRLASAGPDFSGAVVEVQRAEGLVAHAEPGPVSQIILNLLINAAHAMQGKGRIRLRCHKRDIWIVVEVEDEGPGLAPEVMSRLFEPFFTTKASHVGTGLGLAVSRHLARSMGGELSARDPQPGPGACFELRLPASAGPS